jgi:hypothetical protein
MKNKKKVQNNREENLYFWHRAHFSSEMAIVMGARERWKLKEKNS